MLGLSGPQGTGAWRFLWVCVFGALIVSVTLAVLGSDTPIGTRRIVSDLVLIAGGLAGFVTCALRSRQFSGRRRRAWLLFAAAGALTGLSNVVVLTVHIVSDPRFSTLYSAPGFLIALSCGLLGLGQFSATARRGTDLARMIFDCVVIGGALFLVAAALFPKILTTKATNSIELVLPMVDVTVATYALLIFLRVGRSERTVLTFLCAGTALYAATDLTFVVLRAQLQDFEYGSPLDAGWLVGYLLIALAALHPAASREPRCDPPRELSPVIGTMLMYSLLAVAVGLFAFSTLITWSYYSMKAWTYLFGRTPAKENAFKVLYCLFTVVGTVLTFNQVLGMADALLFVCALVNIVGLYLLAPVVLQELRDYTAARKDGRVAPQPVGRRG